MKTALCAIILLAATYCFVGIESQCKGELTTVRRYILKCHFYLGSFLFIVWN